jgi:hypothetical protein
LVKCIAGDIVNLQFGVKALLITQRLAMASVSLIERYALVLMAHVIVKMMKHIKKLSV